MVTAETAVVLPVLLLVLAAAVAAVVVVGAQLRCVDAAREAARAAARGEDPAVVAAVARVTAPRGAGITVTDGDRNGGGGGEVRAAVAAEVAPLGLPVLRVTVRSTAVALREPAVAGGGG